MQHAGSESHALLPSAREFARELIGTAREAEVGDSLADDVAAVGNVVDAGDEIEVLGNSEVVPKGETLGHVADIALDVAALAQNVVAETGAAAGVGTSAGRTSCGW